MDRCALFVDAGYVLTDGAMAVHGTRRRESVSWDYAGLLQLFGNLAMERTRLPLLRCYWYEATVEGRRSADHDTLADLPGVKVRVAKMRPGRREGVEGEIHRDLTTLARNKAVSDVMVVSAEEDLAQVISDVQDMGMRVILLHIATEGNGTVPRALRQECDDFAEISSEHLRPYVELISGAEPPRPDESEGASLAVRSVVNGPVVNGPAVNGAVNGNGMNGNGVNGNGAAPAAGRADWYTQLGRPATEQRPPVPSGPPAPQAAPPDQPARQAPQPAAMDAGQADRGQPERVAVERPSAPDQAAGVDYGSALEYGHTVDYGPVPDYTAPAPPRPAPVPAALPREDIYAAPVALPVPVNDSSADHDRTAGRPRVAGDRVAGDRAGGDLAAYNPGAIREPYQRDGMLREAPSADVGDRLQPAPITQQPGNGSAQIHHLPTRGLAPGGPNQGQPPLGPPPVPTEMAGGQQIGGQQPGIQPSGSQPTGAQPVVPVAPVVPMDYTGARGGPVGGPVGGPRQVIPGPGAPGGPGGPGQVPPAANQGQPGPQGPQVPQPPQGPPVAPAPGGQQVPVAPPEPIGPAGPIGLAGQGGYSGGTPGVSLADAVQSAHEEGQAFGESVARDAPALWLEAVLARKPRMPSDLEARLLQGSALPIDFLLHDEVRHALRRGFWDALERARR